MLNRAVSAACDAAGAILSATSSSREGTLMKYRRLGQSGIQVSEIGLGGWLTVGHSLAREQARNVLDAAFDLGINFLDTANVYAAGKAESTWGELLKGRKRESYVLAT